MLEDCTIGTSKKSTPHSCHLVTVSHVSHVSHIQNHTNLEDPKGCGCVMKHLLFFLADTTMFSWHDPLTFCTTSQEVKSRNVMRGTFAQYGKSDKGSLRCLPLLGIRRAVFTCEVGPCASAGRCQSLSSLGVNSSSKWPLLVAPKWLTGEDQCRCHLGIHQGAFPDSTAAVKHNSCHKYAGRKM